MDMRARENEIMMRDPYQQQALLAAYQQQQAGMLGPVLPASAMAAGETPEPSLLKAVMRHFWLVVLFALIGTGAGYVFIRSVTPLYTSEAKIYIEPSGPKGINDGLGSSQRSNYLYTQAELIMSTPILQLAADRPEMKGLKSFGGQPALAVPYMRKHLLAEVGRKDDIISVFAESPYADEAPIIVNAVVQAYTDQQSQEKRTSVTSVIEQMEKEKAESEAKLAQIDEMRDALRLGAPAPSPA